MYPIEKSKLNNLVDNMKQNGFNPAYPIHVWKKETGEKIVVDGHSRIESCKMIGIKELPIVYHKFDTLDDALLFAYEQQTNRSNLTEDQLLETIENILILQKKQNN